MTTNQATRVKVYQNTDTDYALTTVTDAYGVIHVTDSEGFHATTVDPDAAETILWERSLLHNAKPHQGPAPQIVSPLAPAAQVRPSNLATKGTLTAMTDVQAIKTREALANNGWLRRGATAHYGWASLPVLQAMARRGWLELDHPIRPTYGTVTEAGRNALAAYDAKNGGAR